MARLIAGYEYDIFISYRQKDNKDERWVSEFVEALWNMSSKDLLNKLLGITLDLRRCCQTGMWTK
jgi:hypothetical protein